MTHEEKVIRALYKTAWAGVPTLSRMTGLRIKEVRVALRALQAQDKVEPGWQLTG